MNKSINFFDGETIDNKYVLLSNQDNYIFNKDGLSSYECLTFLIEQGKKSNNYFFRVEYDINMILKNENIPDNFFDGEPLILNIKNKIFEIKYFRNKILIINKISFYDISSLFNKSFVYTLDKLKIEYSRESEQLKKYKGLRKNFKLSDIKNIIEYNKIECRLGIKIIEKLKSIIPENLFTYNFYGASSLTNKFLSNNNIEKYTSQFNFFIPELFETTSYYGGRMESVKIGTFNNCYKYDINSAYPSVIKDLRELKSFTLKKYKNEKIIDTNLYKISIKILDKKLIGLLPVRLKGGYIIFPDITDNWYYGCEVNSVIEYSKKYNIDFSIKEFFDVRLKDKIFPNNEIENLYTLRQKLKSENNELQYIYKILLNGIYGKFAQNVGSKRFQNFYYAGYITSKIRSILLNAVIDNPYDVIFFATDGILTKSKLNLSISNNLGDWDFVKVNKAVVLMSGMYKLIDVNNKVYYGERGYKMDFNKSIKDIRKKGISIVYQNTFIGIRYFNKNSKAFDGYKCKFKKLKKIINPLHQIKRIFNIKKFNIDKNYNSLLLNTNNIKGYINEHSRKKNTTSFDFEKLLSDKGKFHD